MLSFKVFHRWLGVVAAFFIIMFAVSGIILNHRNFFSPLSVSRNFLPADYKLGNWNLGAVKSTTPIGNDTLLLFGNIGVWLTDYDFSFFEPLKKGFKKGIDNQKIFQVLHTPAGNTYAATLSGLYYLKDDSWKIIPLPVEETLVRGLTMRGDTLCVLTRSHLILGIDNPSSPALISHRLPQPLDYKARTSLFRALWVIHSGEILGLPGKILVDIMGIILIILCITGIIWFVAPDLMRALRNHIKTRKRLTKLNRFSIRWHNILGIWAAIFLTITALTGIFLRPPLLITIITSDIANIRGTILDNPNPWHDKLRDLQYDMLTGEFIFSTSEGFYKCDAMLKGPMLRMEVQPPISIMGINVFEQPSPGEFITGSFSGLYSWKPSEGVAYDMITGLAVNAGRGLAHPFGSLPLSGYICTPHGNEFAFDYNAGVLSLSQHSLFPAMPQAIKQQTPIPLWNLALEVHTGRFYSFIFGKFYILFIPIAGLVILSIIISGVVLWIRNNKRKKRIKKL